jgi:hypothetical protein
MMDQKNTMITSSGRIPVFQKYSYQTTAFLFGAEFEFHLLFILNTSLFLVISYLVCIANFKPASHCERSEPIKDSV